MVLKLVGPRKLFSFSKIEDSEELVSLLMFAVLTIKTEKYFIHYKNPVDPLHNNVVNIIMWLTFFEKKLFSKTKKIVSRKTLYFKIFANLLNVWIRRQLDSHS